MIQGVDISNYSGVPTAAQSQCMYDAGVRFVVIGLQHAGIARQQQAACQRFHREYYVDLPGRDLTIPEPGATVYIDVEPGCFTDVASIDAELASLGAHALVAGMYGNQTSMAPAIGTTTRYGFLPLFYANYPADGQPPDFDTFVPFNGWTRPTVWQYVGTTDLCGVNVDLDVMEDAPVPEPVPVPTFAEQLDADNAMDSRILAYQFGRPLPPMTARQVEVYDWLNKQPKQ